ncbi:7313_t:CDS:2, partial [Acaulospora colombiana]
MSNTSQDLAHNKDIENLSTIGPILARCDRRLVQRYKSGRNQENGQPLGGATNSGVRFARIIEECGHEENYPPKGYVGMAETRRVTAERDEYNNNFDGGETRKRQSVYTIYATTAASHQVFLLAGEEGTEESQNTEWVLKILMKELEKYEDVLDHDLEDMCFSDYLLDETAWGDNISSEHSKRRRLETKTLAIDFDNGDLTAASPSLQHKQRAVRVVTKVLLLETMPQVSQKFAEHYQRLFPDRLRKFPPNEPEIILITESRELEYGLHHLRYEAESLFWALLFWYMTAQPHHPPEWEAAVDKRFKKILGHNDLGCLVDVDDRRDLHFISDFLPAYLHPGYSSLPGLLSQMAEQFIADPDYS